MKPEHLAPPEDSLMQWDHRVCLQGSKKLMQSLMVVTGSTKTSEDKNQQSGGGERKAAPMCSFPMPGSKPVSPTAS